MSKSLSRLPADERERRRVLLARANAAYDIIRQSPGLEHDDLYSLIALVVWGPGAPQVQQ